MSRHAGRPRPARGRATHPVVHATTRNLPNLLRNFVLAAHVLRTERPGIVISAGAGVAVPFFLLAWLLRIPTVFIEVYDRVDSPTLTGRLCGPFTTRRIVQWEQQLGFYRTPFSWGR